jgi:hypothetical protein
VELIEPDEVEIWASGTGRFYLELLSAEDLQHRHSKRTGGTNFVRGSSSEDFRFEAPHGAGSYVVVARNPEWNLPILIEFRLRITRPASVLGKDGDGHPSPALPRWVTIHRPGAYSPKWQERGLVLRFALWILGWSGLVVLVFVADFYALAITQGSALPEIIVGNATLVLAFVTYYGYRGQLRESRLTRARRPPET